MHIQQYLPQSFDVGLFLPFHTQSGETHATHAQPADCMSSCLPFGAICFASMHHVKPCMVHSAALINLTSK